MYYFDREEQARVDAMLMNEALRKEKESGIELGKALGEELGETRGEAKGALRKSFSIAKNMFESGVAWAQIKQFTGLSDALLERARKGEALTDADFPAKS